MKFQTVKEKDNSPDWERIKSFVGGANKASKHPLEQEMERRKQREPEHMADGGTVGGFDIGGSGSDTQRMGGRLPLQIDPRGTIPNVPGVPALPNVAPQVAPRPILPAPAAPPVAVSPSPMPDSGSDAGIDDQATKIMGGITPETINRLMESLNRQGKVGQIGAGVAGIGDAIASVGGQNPGHMKNAQDLIQKNKESALKVPGEMAAIGKEHYGLTKELGGDDPTSKRSFVAQEANRPLLSKMGFTPQEIKKMPASLIDGIRSGAITRENALATINAEAAYKTAGLDLQSKQLEQTKSLEQQRIDAANEKEASDVQTDAAKALASRGVFKTIQDAIPGTAGNKAKNVLEKQLEGEQSFTPDVTAYAQKHGITPAQALAIKEGRGGK